MKMRKVNLKYARVKKYKLKTRKAFQKRFDLVRTYLPPPDVYFDIVWLIEKQNVQVSCVGLPPSE